MLPRAQNPFGFNEILRYRGKAWLSVPLCRFRLGCCMGMVSDKADKAGDHFEHEELVCL